MRIIIQTEHNSLVYQTDFLEVVVDSRGFLNVPRLLLNFLPVVLSFIPKVEFLSSLIYYLVCLLTVVQSSDLAV